MAFIKFSALGVKKPRCGLPPEAQLVLAVSSSSGRELREPSRLRLRDALRAAYGHGRCAHDVPPSHDDRTRGAQPPLYGAWRLVRDARQLLDDEHEPDGRETVPWPCAFSLAVCVSYLHFAKQPCPRIVPREGKIAHKPLAKEDGRFNGQPCAEGFSPAEAGRRKTASFNVRSYGYVVRILRLLRVELTPETKKPAPGPLRAPFRMERNLAKRNRPLISK
jgi:hypothetical protein